MTAPSDNEDAGGRRDEPFPGGSLAGRGGPPAERLREQLRRELGEVPRESPSEPAEGESAEGEEPAEGKEPAEDNEPAEDDEPPAGDLDRNEEGGRPQDG